MDFFKRKTDSGADYEDLPESRELPELPSSSVPDLPRLPELPKQHESRPLVVKNELPAPKRTIELSDINQIKSQIMKKEPVFVKIDKFQDMMKKISEIKEKAGQIERSLANIKSIKDREDQELKTWESEIRLVKEKIVSIENSFSNKI